MTKRTPFRTVLFASALAMLVFSGCSGSTEPVRPTAAPATDAPTATEPIADGSTVAAGQWGVVRYLSTDDQESLAAIRTTATVAGKKGDFADVTVPGLTNVDELTPYFVSYSWVTLSGDDHFSPTQNLVGQGADDLVTLQVPSDLRRCDPPESENFGWKLGYEIHGCAVVASASGPPTSLVFQGPEGSSAEVTFQVPAPASK